MGHHKHDRHRDRDCKACGCSNRCAKSIAEAQIGSNNFTSNNGFRTLNHSGPGLYALTLCRCYNPCRLVVNATLKGTTFGGIAVQLSSSDSTDTVNISTFGSGGTPADADFFIDVKLLPHGSCPGCDDDDDDDDDNDE